MVYFIKPSDVIKRIRSTIVTIEATLDLPAGFKSYGQNVGGSAFLNSITDTDVQNFPTPSCFVVLTDNTNNTNRTEKVDQDVFHGFDIVVVLDTVDSRQQEAEERIVTFKELLIYCLNGWKPTKYTDGSPLRLVGDSTVFSDKSKYVRVFTFAQDTRFNSCADGYHDNTEFDLQNFENFFADLHAGDSQLKLQLTDLNEES